MKVYIGPYLDWIGPYQIAEKILFWKDKYEDDSVHNFGRWLAEKKNGEPTWLAKFCQEIHEHRERKVKVKLHKYDSWNVDVTLAPIILALLKQLKENQHGSPMVDPADVPEHLRVIGKNNMDHTQYQFIFEDNEQYEKDSWDIVHRQWAWVLDEMIWAFEQKVNNDYRDDFSIGEVDVLFQGFDSNGNKLGEPKKIGEDGPEGVVWYQMVDGPNHTRKTDYEKLAAHEARMQNGFALFGKYYNGLWD